jgi:hypothetical protein
MNINKNTKDTQVKLELDFIKATVLLDILSTNLDSLLGQSSIESMIKYIASREIAKDILDQIVPVEEQEKVVRDHHEMLLQALKKERERKSE